MDEFDVWLSMLTDAVVTFAAAKGDVGRDQVVKMMEHSVLRIGLLHRGLEVRPQPEHAFAGASDADLLHLLEEAQDAPTPKIFQPRTERATKPCIRVPDELEHKFHRLMWIEDSLADAENWAEEYACVELREQVAKTHRVIRRELGRLEAERMTHVETQLNAHSTASTQPRYVLH